MYSRYPNSWFKIWRKCYISTSCFSYSIKSLILACIRKCISFTLIFHSSEFEFWFINLSHHPPSIFHSSLTFYIIFSPVSLYLSLTVSHLTKMMTFHRTIFQFLHVIPCDKCPDIRFVIRCPETLDGIFIIKKKTASELYALQILKLM